MTASPSAELVAVDALAVEFRIGESQQVLRAVDGVSFTIRRGETLGIIGESGSGKSTVARSLVCLQKPAAGRLTLAGEDPWAMRARQFRAFRPRFQIVFQDPNAALDPRFTILASICEPLEIRGGLSRAECRDRAVALMEKVGLSPAQAERYPHELSGGQKQRANIARALTLRPDLLVCDEVTAALDVSIQADIINLLVDMQQDFALTYVFITHDLSIAAYVSDRIAVMYLGVFVEIGTSDDVTGRPLHPYTRALTESAPEPLPAHLRRPAAAPLVGEIPSPLAPPSGCRFRTRCPIAQATCAETVPALRELRPGQFVACHFAEAS